MNNQWHQTRKRERGQTSAEFVMVLPFLLLLFFLMVDFGWIFKNYIVVTNTVREVARCASVGKCEVGGSEVGPEALAQARISAGLLTNIEDYDEDSEIYFQITYEDIDGSGELTRGDSIIVCLQVYNKYISPVIPFLSMVTGGGGDELPDPLPLRARSALRAESRSFSGDYANIPEDEGSCGFT